MVVLAGNERVCRFLLTYAVSDPTSRNSRRDIPRKTIEVVSNAWLIIIKILSITKFAYHLEVTHLRIGVTDEATSLYRVSWQFPQNADGSATAIYSTSISNYEGLSESM